MKWMRLLMLALVVAALGGCFSDDSSDRSSYIERPFVDDSFTVLQSASEATVKTYQGLLQNQSPSQARLQLASDLAAKSGIKASGVSEDSITVWWQTDDGVEYALLTETRASLTSTTVKAMSPGQPRVAGSAFRPAGPTHNERALILSPYQWQWNLFEIVPMGDETGFIDNLLKTVGYSTVYKVNHVHNDQHITLEDYTRWNEYGIVALATHGGVDRNGQVFFATGVMATPELYQQHLDDLKNGRLILVVYIDKWFTDRNILAFGVKPGWFERYYPSGLDSTMVYAGACKSQFNSTMADAVTGRNTCYFGWDQSVDTRQAAATGKDLFTQLVSNALPSGNAYQAVLADGNGTYTPPPGSTEPQAHFLMAGDPTLWLVSTPRRIAATPAYYDDIGGLLESFGYHVDIIDLDQLSSYAVLVQYDIVGINCAEDLPDYSGQAAPALRAYVSNGGKLYTSDFAFTFVQEAFPGYVTFPEYPYVGLEQTVTASVDDQALRDYLGSASVDIVYDLGGWVPIETVANTTRVLLSGDVVAATAGGLRPPPDRRHPGLESSGARLVRPLAVSFQYGRGTVVYTSFHNEAQVGDAARHILEYFTILE